MPFCSDGDVEGFVLESVVTDSYSVVQGRVKASTLHADNGGGWDRGG